MFFFPFCFLAQSRLKIIPVLSQQPIRLNKWLRLGETDSVQITKLRFYISRINYYQSGRVIKQDSLAHLMDLENENGLSLFLPEETELIYFTLGIDSIINVSGAMGGDLDPTKGMYWAWQSGYINFKMEGKCSRASTADKSFQYHLGGYLPPFQSAQQIQLVVPKADTIIYLDLTGLFSNSDFASSPVIMSPGKNAVVASKILANSFKVK